VSAIAIKGLITVAVKTNGTVTERLKLRRIIYKTREGKRYIYVTNDFTLQASKIATIYKNRWMIDYSNTVAFNELCGAIGVHKRYL
jgi:hypothetical protein